jgi:large conductance mechanosensitive channel
MSVLSEFKAFAMRGNVIDLAVGVVIGAAFGKIVSSLVDNIIMPPLGVLINGVDFKALALTLVAADPATNKPAVVLGYGMFLQNVLDFLIIAFAIFMVVRGINKLMPAPKPAPKNAPSQEELLMQIRDLLAKKK